MQADWLPFAKALIGSWPGQQWDEETLGLYVEQITARGVSPEVAIQVLRSFTGAFPPSAGQVGAAAEIVRQGPPPGFYSMHRMIAKHVAKLDYHRPQSNFDRFIAAVAEEHEVAARFAVELGPRGVREFPDPARSQDQGGSVALTRAEKSYTKLVREWEADPRPGVALTEAKRMTLSSGGGMQTVLDDLRPAGELESGDVDGDLAGPE